MMKKKRYAERDSGRDEKDQGSGVASEGFFSVSYFNPELKEV